MWIHANIPSSHVESRFDRKETRETKDVRQIGQIYMENRTLSCKERLSGNGRKKENGKKTDQELERDENRKVSRQGVGIRDR